MAPPTILAHKSAFLHAQTLQLSRGLTPSAGWRASWRADEDDEASESGERAAGARAPPLTDRAVDEAVYRLNHRLQQHARRVYAPQATRNVAEQTEALFLDFATARDDDDDGGGGGGGAPEKAAAGEDEPMQGSDLALDSTIVALPPAWDQFRPAEAAAHPAEAQRYAELQTTLAALAARRAEARARLDRLRAMDRLLRPFRDGTRRDDEDPDGAGAPLLQRNLVTRNGEVEEELERMRMLLVRVAGRVAQLPDRPAAEAETVPDLDEAERDKVRNVLDSL